MPFAKLRPSGRPPDPLSSSILWPSSVGGSEIAGIYSGPSLLRTRLVNPSAELEFGLGGQRFGGAYLVADVQSADRSSSSLVMEFWAPRPSTGRRPGGR